MGPAAEISWWRSVTAAGDPALLGPVILAMALILGWTRSWHEAWWLARAWLAAALGVALLKLVLLSCGQHWMPGLESPSGHACMAVVAYGALGTIFAAGRPVRVQALIALATFALVLGIAASRVVLRVHSVIEVLIGLEIGAAALLVFALPWRRRRAPAIDPLLPLLMLAITAFAASGMHVNMEGVIRHLARHVAEFCRG